MSKSTKEKLKDLSFSVKVDPTKVKQFTEKGDFEAYLGSIRCGNTIHKPKKGKGSYSRKPKHKGRGFE